ncbi:MAG: GNAT family N-acetyltransferase [Actinomycetota bacterium]|nr:GNAT family N-acetyltransferase [Actinomycetota bacterium]
MIDYVTSPAGVNVAQLAGGFFEGWASPPTPEEHRLVLERASHVVLAVEDDSAVGFVNAISDGVLTAYVPLLEVLPGHRGRGIGSELVRRLLVEIGPLYMVDVMCDADVFPFYERLGFHRTGGAVLRNHAWRAQR